MSRLSDDDAWARLAGARSAVLATAAADGTADLVPVVFAAVGAALYFAVDDVKPKDTLALGRLAGIGRDPRVTVLAERYDDDWSQLWWVRARGTATVVTGTDEAGTALAGLAAKYPPYAEHPPPGAVVRIDVSALHGWTATAGP